MDLKNRILLAFNKFYGNFIKDIKSINDDLRTVVKNNYKVIEKLTDVHMIYLLEVIGDDFDKILKHESRSEILEFLGDKMIIKDASVSMILDAIDNDKDRDVFWNYMYILFVLMLIFKDYEKSGEEEDKKSTEILFNAVISVISKIQQGEDGVESVIEEIIDDDVSTLLKRLKIIKLVDDKSAQSPFGENNMICNLAKEISNEIDTSKINIDKPEDVLKLMDFSSSNNIVGDIIKKVSSKIHDKINTGELKQEDLFGEAINMMNMMNKGGGGAGGMGGLGDLMSGMSGMFNNPMMSEMMKSMKKGKAVPRQDVLQKATTRDRLRAKLEQRKA